MRRFVPIAGYLAALLGCLAMLLRAILLLAGTDSRGLYPRAHPAWVLSCVLALAAAAFFFLLSRHTDTRRPYRSNFPPSSTGALGYYLAAVGFALTGIGERGEYMGGLLLPVALLCTLALALGGWARLRGRMPAFYIHLLPCLYLALRLFFVGRVLGAEPEASRYLLRFLSVWAAFLASYQLWGFDVGRGNRNSSLFWSLTAGFLCLAAAPGSPDWLLLLTLGLWLLTNLCDPRPRRRRRRPPVGQTIL